ncbi:putative MFS family arabinose efflux permease [Paenibacillus rhizosphaerae]|uniref:Putative MFS family arabinose efflux permease n=1 Tax=Paenibacillus rhizosphaerae TaxID=297318 RepID=A0A839TVE8_9BACL|nr:hypothetical protein [Paenibacillus rhizosphaerae]MBB3128667.1 putative MFS family arabinose efflux permease [Paenibacillus rhizosphaerae]
MSWILVLFGVGVTLGNYIDGRLADWKLNISLIALTIGLGASLLALTWASHGKAAAVIDVFLLGIFIFGILPCLTINVMNKAMGAPNLATTMNVSALHIANATGAWLGGVVIDSKYGLHFVPLFASLVTALGVVVTQLGLMLSPRSVKERANLT